MIDAGVIWMLFSVESAVPRLQKYIKKDLDIEKLTQVINYACEKEIMVQCCAMVGFPTESIEEAKQTIEYMKQFNKIVIPMYFSVKYYPNTEVYDLALENGENKELIAKAYQDSFHNIKHSETRQIPNSQFQVLYLKFLQEVFLSGERLKNSYYIQKKFMTEQEILDMYSIFFRRKINNIEKEVLSLGY